jgi:16S rRNA processing protein RimM
MSEIRWVELAEVSRPHGVRGELRVKVYNSDSELLPSQPEVRVRHPDGRAAMVALDSVRAASPGYLLVKFRGVDDRDAADAYRGAKLCVPRDAFPPLEPGEVYVCDIVGARVVGPRGELGTVEDLTTYPSADVLVVRLDDGARGEIPLIDDFVASIEPADGQIRLTVAGLDFISGEPVRKPDAV